MTTTPKSVSHRDYLLVEVVASFKSARFYKGELLIKITGSLYETDEFQIEGLELPPGNYSIVGVAKDLTEEQWKKIVDEEWFADESVMYVDYNDDDLFFKKATESGHSLLASHSLFNSKERVMKNGNWLLQYYLVRYTEKYKRVEILSYQMHECKSKDEALGIAYNNYDHSCVKSFGNNQWGASNLSRYNFSFSTVYKISHFNYGYGTGFTIATKESKQRFLKMLLVFWEATMSNGRNGFDDNSLSQNRWHRLYSMPKGHRLLRPGETILETDKEYDSGVGMPRYNWGVVNWYNVGKKVQKGHGILIKRKGHKDRHIPAGIDPIICRKIKAQ